MHRVTGERLGSTIKEFSQRAGICIASTYDLIRAGRLKARKFGKRTIILETDAQEFLNALPELQLPPREPRKGQAEAA